MKKIAIVGAGGMATYHLEGYRTAGCDVVAICDLAVEKAKAFADKNEIAHAFSGIAELKASIPDVEAVSVITPNKFHHTLVMEALSAGLHVFCEKPPALNAAQITEMHEMSIKMGKTLMFNFNNRAKPESKAMMKYIEDGVVGTINSAQASWIRRAGIPGFGGWFTNKELSGGGPVIDLLHMLDLSLHFMGCPEADYVLAKTYNTFMDNPAFKGPWGIPDSKDSVNDVESSCHAFITFKTGQCLMMRSSWAEMNEREVASVVFQGTKAGGKVERLFEIDGVDETSIDSCMLYTEENGHQVNRKVITPKDETMGRVESVVNFVKTLEGKEEPLNTSEQAVKLMKIIDALFESERIKAPVKL